MKVGANMGRQCLIGVDIGTTGTKTAVFDAEGTLVAESFEPSRLIQPRPGWVEQDADEMADSVIRTICDCMTKSRLDGGDIAGIAIDGQMAGVMAVDVQGRAVTRYDSWLDSRCKPYIDQLEKGCGYMMYDRTGCAPMLNHAPKMLWWKHEEPEFYRRIYKFVQPGAYAAMRLADLSGRDAFVDHTYIHFSGCCDTRRREWDEELCSRSGIDLDKLPRIVNPCDVIGAVSHKTAARTGLKAGTPIVAGCGDTCACFVGTGMVVPGLFLDVAGTACVMAACTDTYHVNSSDRTFLLAHSIGEHLWHPYAYMNGAGLNLKWFRDEFANKRLAESNRIGFSALDGEAATVAPGSDNLIFIPHLAGRVCPSQPNLRGTWLGFSWGHTQAHFYRAVLEAVAYEYRYYLKSYLKLFPDTPPREVRVIGGGCKSTLWNQIKSDVLGIPYVTLNREDGATLGAAIVAGLGIGLYKDIAATTQTWIKTKDHIEPDPKRHRQYQEFSTLYEQHLSDLNLLYSRKEASHAASSNGGARPD